MPVVFASAEKTDKLLYYAFVNSVEVDHERSVTRYGFTNLTPIEDHYPLSTLRLRSSNRPLSDNFIMPYAICHTPSFIAEGHMGQR